MIEWSDTDLLVREAVRNFVDDQIRPHVDDLEHGALPPYDLIRKFYAAFGLDQFARDTFEKANARAKARERGESRDRTKSQSSKSSESGGQESMMLIAASEPSRVSMGMVTALGVSVGLAATTILSRGTAEQERRWALDLLTFDKVGAWAITEPDAGSDAFGGMRTTVRPDGAGGYVLSGQKTFITNGPYADTLVVYAKLDDGTGVERRRQPVLTFVLDSGMEGLTQSKPFRKMGLHASPTGELFFDEVRLGPDRLLGSTEGKARDGRDSARSNFTTERIGVGAMALGIIEECLRLCVDYARQRELWGRPIADFQLIQLKLAQMEIARLNVTNMLFRVIEQTRKGRRAGLTEASAIKLYCSQAATDVAMEAVQLFGGNGYMAEYRVEQLARDAKSLMIYAGSNEVQVTHVAKGLLAG
ncbi:MULTISPECIES: acyl-CoA dehydrogenase family protein [unclassified Streptomyces]|uniref:acyl-CoA dehydrogenase family protein n=1 Tax=unclassified Streptomyces TaxID=2593676 RepID=UPI002367290B|nr:MULTISPECIES: acyl-CoA dehydrogenase family protein [unclassified Streptomyces]MDF3147109.1 acyl-CoA dehydrogenase family protein [Streptomyces sp. T21Q-yed]WDF36061.1 acyl-CoA dehydrogenase family protein [Streptomyces sp. T12]